ncbi:MAG: tetratricopeptide repeat protein [Parachlamydia sp.]|nr:tetratricopeptide repeat protein [Parachlamydia sp.]
MALLQKPSNDKVRQVVLALMAEVRSLGNAKKATEYFEEALRIDKKVHGDEHPDVAIRLRGLGSAWECLRHCKKSHRIL